MISEFYWISAFAISATLVPSKEQAQPVAFECRETCAKLHHFPDERIKNSYGVICEISATCADSGFSI